MNASYDGESRQFDQPNDLVGEMSPGAQAFAPDFPIFRQLGRTGASRYSPTVRNDRFGRVFTYSPDSVTVQEYDEMRMDAQIVAGLALIKMPIQQCGWSIQCEDPDISAFLTEIIKPIWPDFIRQAMLALDFGYSVFEKVWGKEYDLTVTQTQGQADDANYKIYQNADVIEKMMQLDPQTLYLLGYRWSGEFAGVRQYLAGSATIPDNKCFIFSHNIEFSEWYGVSRLKPCYPFWIFKRLMYEFINVRYELWSMPMKLGRYPMGKSETGVDPNTGQPSYVYNADQMMSILEELRSNFAVTLPSNQYENGQFQWGIELLQNGTNGSDHLQYIDHLNLMILKGLLVPQLALEIG